MDFPPCLPSKGILLFTVVFLRRARIALDEMVDLDQPTVICVRVVKTIHFSPSLATGCEIDFISIKTNNKPKCATNAQH